MSDGITFSGKLRKQSESKAILIQASKAGSTCF